MTLEEIKDQVAKEYLIKMSEYGKWDVLTYEETIKLWPEVCRRACEETGRLTLEKAADDVKIVFDDEEYLNVTILRNSIKDPSNIVLLK